MGDTTRIPIDLRMPDITGNPGNVSFNHSALAAATPDFDLGHWEFVENVDGAVFGTVNIPNTIGATPAAKIVIFVCSNDTGGTVTTFRVDARPIADAEVIDQALDTTVTNQDLTLSATAYTLKEASFTLPTSGNDFPVVAKDQLLVRIEHEGADGDDTLASPTILFSAFLEIDLS